MRGIRGGMAMMLSPIEEPQNAKPVERKQTILTPITEKGSRVGKGIADREPQTITPGYVKEPLQLELPIDITGESETKGENQSEDISEKAFSLGSALERVIGSTSMT